MKKAKPLPDFTEKEAALLIARMYNRLRSRGPDPTACPGGGDGF